MLPQDGALRRIVIRLFAAVPLLFGGLALILGQDANWDLRNYHWYDAYAALNGRLAPGGDMARQDMAGQDMAAAQIATFYNPTLDVPFYLLAGAIPARLFGFFLGVLQGGNFILLYLLASAVLRFGGERLQVLGCAVIALAGVIGGGHLGLVGTLFYDNVISLLVLAAILVIASSAAVLQHGPWRAALPRAALAGVLVGLGVGLKLPTQIFAVGICFGLLFVPGPPVRRLVLAFFCGLGIVAGFAVFGGWWWWQMWSDYANPLFPYFNDVLRSPWALAESYRDDRYLPRSFAAALTLPFRTFVDGTVAGEIAFRDGRVLGAYIVLLATPFALLAARFKPAGAAPPPIAPGLAPDVFAANVFAARFLTAAAVLSYLLWLKLFAIYRYIIPLEMLAPLIVVASLAFWPAAVQRRLSLAIGLVGFMTLTIQPGTWGRVPWGPGLGGKVVDVVVPDLTDPAATLVLMTGFAPTAFVIPAFPPAVAFLRPHSYFIEPSHRTRFNAVMHARIATHRGDIYVLHAVWEKAVSEQVLPLLGLRLEAAACRPVRANLDAELELCAVTRASIVTPSML